MRELVVELAQISVEKELPNEFNLRNEFTCCVRDVLSLALSTDITIKGITDVQVEAPVQ